MSSGVALTKTPTTAPSGGRVRASAAAVASVHVARRARVEVEPQRVRARGPRAPARPPARVTPQTFTRTLMSPPPSSPSSRASARPGSASRSSDSPTSTASAPAVARRREVRERLAGRSPPPAPWPGERSAGITRSAVPMSVLQRGEVAVVDAHQLRARRERALGVLLRVGLHQRRHAQLPSRRPASPAAPRPRSASAMSSTASAPQRRALLHLARGDEEVLAQHRQRAPPRAPRPGPPGSRRSPRPSVSTLMALAPAAS